MTTAAQIAAIEARKTRPAPLQVQISGLSNRKTTNHGRRTADGRGTRQPRRRLLPYPRSQLRASGSARTSPRRTPAATTPSSMAPRYRTHCCTSRAKHQLPRRRAPPTHSRTASRLARIRPRLTSPVSRSEASKVIHARCRSNPAKIATGASSKPSWQLPIRAKAEREPEVNSPDVDSSRVLRRTR